jgi:O-antigen ligase
MPEPASRSTSQSLVTRVLLGLVVLLVAWFVFQSVLDWLFAMLRIALLLGLLAIVGWFVLIGPSGSDDE